MDEVIVFSLKVIVLFLGCVGVVLAMLMLMIMLMLMFVHVLSSKECVCCVCDPSGCLGVCVHVCSLHVSDLCVCMTDVISKYNSEIEGSPSFCALMLFLCSSLCLMCSGSSLHVESGRC